MRFPQPQINQKVCLLGDSATEKSALLRPAVYSMMHDKYLTSIGTKVTKRSFEFDRPFEGRPVHSRVTLLLWGILGQNQYTRLHPVYYQGALGGVVVCRPELLETVPAVLSWALGLRDAVGEVPLMISVHSSAADGSGEVPSLVRDLAGELHAQVATTRVWTPERTERALADFVGVLLCNYLDGVVLAPGPPKPLPHFVPKGRVGWWARRRSRKPAAPLPSTAHEPAAESPPSSKRS